MLRRSPVKLTWNMIEASFRNWEIKWLIKFLWGRQTIIQSVQLICPPVGVPESTGYWLWSNYSWSCAYSQRPWPHFFVTEARGLIFWLRLTLLDDCWTLPQIATDLFHQLLCLKVLAVDGDQIMHNVVLTSNVLDCISLSLKLEG